MDKAASVTRTGLDRILIVGASLAGLRAAQTLRAEGYSGILTIVGSEPHMPYDRPPLSKQFLTHDSGAESVALRGSDDLSADWVLGTAAERLDLHTRTLATAGGKELGFDGLVIATGSAPRRLPGLDPALPGVQELRTIDDALQLREAMSRRPRLVIVGCGFIGVELASTGRALGVDVSVVSLDPALCIAGPLVSRVCTEQLADHGVDVRVGRRIQHVLGAGRVEALVLDDGTRLDADHVVVAVGAVPTTSWLKTSGITVADGVVCDASSAVADVDRVVAAGDVARWENPLFGGASMRVEHWSNAVEQGMAAARTLLHGRGDHTAYAALPTFWSDHFGIRLQSVGLPAAADRIEIVEGSVEDRRFAAACYRDEKLVGAIAYDMPRAVVRLRAQLARPRTGARV